jgi:hypothetical protein
MTSRRGSAERRGGEQLTLAGGTVSGLRFYPLPGELTVVCSSVRAPDGSLLSYELTSQQPTATIAVVSAIMKLSSEGAAAIT